MPINLYPIFVVSFYLAIKYVKIKVPDKRLQIVFLILTECFIFPATRQSFDKIIIKWKQAKRCFVLILEKCIIFLILPCLSLETVSIFEITLQILFISLYFLTLPLSFFLTHFSKAFFLTLKYMLKLIVWTELGEKRHFLQSLGLFNYLLYLH